MLSACRTMPFCLSLMAAYRNPLPSSLHIAFCQRTAAPPRPNFQSRQGFLFPLSLSCLKCYQRVGVFIKEVNFKGFHLCRCPPPPSSFYLAGVWQSKVNKCEMGHVFSILFPLSHMFSSLINIPPTPGPLFLANLRASRRLACQNTPRPPGITEISKPTLPVHLKSIEPITRPPPPRPLPECRMTRFWRLCLFWKTWLFFDRLFIGLR